MTKKNKIILGLTVLVIIIGMVAFWPKKEIKKAIVDEKITIPTQNPVKYISDTGAVESVLSTQQYDEVYLIKKLRNSMPMDREYFIIDFDYGINKFVVVYKDVKNGRAEFEKWLNNTGYNVISKQYFQIK